MTGCSARSGKSARTSARPGRKRLEIARVLAPGRGSCSSTRRSPASPRRAAAGDCAGAQDSRAGITLVIVGTHGSDHALAQRVLVLTRHVIAHRQAREVAGTGGHRGLSRSRPPPGRRVPRGTETTCGSRSRSALRAISSLSPTFRSKVAEGQHRRAARLSTAPARPRRSTPCRPGAPSGRVDRVVRRSKRSPASLCIVQGIGAVAGGWRLFVTRRRAESPSRRRRDSDRSRIASLSTAPMRCFPGLPSDSSSLPARSRRRTPDARARTRSDDEPASDSFASRAWDSRPAWSSASTKRSTGCTTKA